MLFRSDRRSVRLEWEDVPEAAAYWLEISEDRSFEKTLVSLRNLKVTLLERDLFPVCISC